MNDDDIMQPRSQRARDARSISTQPRTLAEHVREMELWPIRRLERRIAYLGDRPYLPNSARLIAEARRILESRRTQP